MAYPFRLMLIFLTLPFHAFLGTTIMGQKVIIGEEWYRSPADGAGCPTRPPTSTWPAGSCGGPATLIGLLFFGVLFVQWARASMREAKREDRRLDRLEARAEAAARRTGDGSPDGG